MADADLFPVGSTVWVWEDSTWDRCVNGQVVARCGTIRHVRVDGVTRITPYDVTARPYVFIYHTEAQGVYELRMLDVANKTQFGYDSYRYEWFRALHRAAREMAPGLVGAGAAG